MFFVRINVVIVKTSINFNYITLTLYRSIKRDFNRKVNAKFSAFFF